MSCHLFVSCLVLFRVVFRLPNENQLFLRYLMPLLHHISRSADVNGMTSANLAICFAPSLLWPSSGLDVIKNEVPPLIQFFIEYCPDIFGAELPVLYKQAQLPPSPVENMEMEFSATVPTTKQFVPTKVDDGDKCAGKFLTGHKRNDSMDSSISEESTSAEVDDEQHNRHRHNYHHNSDASNSLLRARRSGLTVSDSQLSHISQMDDYAPSNPSSNNSFETNSSSSSKPRQVRKRGTIVTSGQHIHNPDPFSASGSVGIGGGFSGGVDKPSPKRIKKGRVPERSSSLHGPNDMFYRRAKNARTVSTVVPPPSSIRPMPDAFHRRKSIATQELHQPRDFMSEFPPIPSSSNSSFGSSHSYSPKMLQRIQQSKELYARHDPSHSKSSIRRHAHSFTCKDVERPVRTIPASSSFYDSLSPLEAEELRSGRVGNGRVGEHHSSGKYHVRLEVPKPTKDELHPRPILANAPSSYVSNSQQAFSNTSARAGPGGFSDSPDNLLPGGNVDGEYLKVAISERFNLGGAIGGMGIPPPSTPSSASSTSTTTFTTPDNRLIGEQESTPTREDMYTPAGSESGQDSLERVQKKFHDRKRLDGSEVPDMPTTFTNSPSYRVFLNNQQKGDSLMSLTEESGIDDRPECDFHLESLSRQMARGINPTSGAAALERTGAVGGTRNLTLEVTMSHDQDHARANGYNSDTESAPSRTLSRPGKLKEVSSPTKVTMPSRYHHGMVPHSYEAAGNGKRTLSTYQKQQTQQHSPLMRLQQQDSPLMRLQQQDSPLMKLQQQDPTARATITTSSSSSSSKDHLSNLVQSLPADFSAPSTAMADPPMTTTTLFSSSSSSSQVPPSTRSSTKSGGRHRPKSGDSKVERLTEIYKANEANERDQVNADVEHAKVKLGLIPQQQSVQVPRHRSKSTSEKEAMKILHKLMGEDSSATSQKPPSQEDERASKHKEWLSSAPTSAERKKAWESQNNAKTTSPSQFHRMEYKSRSLRNTEVPPNGGGDKIPMTTVTTTTKVKVVSSTPADTKRKCATLPDMINGKQTKMVKVRTYEIPEVQRIRRINLRTYH